MPHGACFTYRCLPSLAAREVIQEKADNNHKAPGAIAPGASMVWQCGSVFSGTSPIGPRHSDDDT
jgi:hypothetical protein